MNTSKIKVLLVDDEPVSRERIRKLLSLDPDILIVGESKNGREALGAIARSAPDVAIVEADMPILGGFGIVSALFPAARPLIIFTSDTTEHAVRAFDVNALDYLIKPVPTDRLRQAMMRARDVLTAPTRLGELQGQCVMEDAQ